MHPAERELLVRVAPAYICAGAFAVYSWIQIRNIKRQSKLSQIEHDATMKGIKEAGRERMDRYEAWKSTQPKTVQEHIEKARETARKEIGSVDDLRRKMDDPNYVWEL